MNITKHNRIGEKWQIGNIVTDDQDYYIIVYDNLTSKVRLVSIATGNILTDEYKSIEELKKINGELDPNAIYAEISVF